MFILTSGFFYKSFAKFCRKGGGGCSPFCPSPKSTHVCYITSTHSTDFSWLWVLPLSDPTNMTVWSTTKKLGNHINLWSLLLRLEGAKLRFQLCVFFKIFFLVVLLLIHASLHRMSFGPQVTCHLKRAQNWTTFEPNQTNIDYCLFKCLKCVETFLIKLGDGAFIYVIFRSYEKLNNLQLLTPFHFQMQDTTLHSHVNCEIIQIKRSTKHQVCMRSSKNSKNSRHSSLLSCWVDQLQMWLVISSQNELWDKKSRREDYLCFVNRFC